MEIFEKHIRHAQWKDLRVTYSYVLHNGVKLKRSINFCISGKILEPLTEKEAGKLLYKLSLVVRGKDEATKEPEI